MTNAASPFTRQLHTYKTKNATVNANLIKSNNVFYKYIKIYTYVQNMQPTSMCCSTTCAWTADNQHQYVSRILNTSNYTYSK